jgi:hypothetical protein
MLTVRVALSVSLVAFLVLSYYMGWIGPGGIKYPKRKGRTATVRPSLAAGPQTSQYTSTKSSSHTTSTKCQYHADASNAKWWSAVKCPLNTRNSMTSSMVAPIGHVQAVEAVSM